MTQSDESEEVVSPGFPCPICGESLHGAVKKCRHCGEWIERSCEGCNTPLRGIFAARGVCAECAEVRNSPPVLRMARPVVEPKSKGVAILLALFLGGLGLHRFYLDRTGSGLVYLIFFWTLIPALIAFFEVFRLAFMSDDEFHRKYG